MPPMGDSSTDIAVVVRYTAYEGVGPADCVSLMRAFRDLAEADAEAARLNSVRRNSDVEYFVKIVSLEPASHWLPVLEISASADTWLGVQDDEWMIAHSVEGPGEPIAGRPMIPAWPLLEQDPAAVRARLAAAAAKGSLPPFPFGLLLSSAMRSEMDYWAGLALDWANVIGVDAAVRDAAADLHTAPWASQRTRQRAKRIARGHGGDDR